MYIYATICQDCLFFMRTDRFVADEMLRKSRFSNNATSSCQYMEHRAPAKSTLSNVDFR